MSNEFHPSLHSASRHRDGRTFGRYHNDREGETFSEECHVVPELSKDNIYYNVIDDCYYTHADAQNGSYSSFKDSEDDFIKDALKDAYEAQQERHRAHRQYNRCKSIDDWYENCRKSGKITVDQVWMQIGKYDKEIHIKSVQDMLEPDASMSSKATCWNETLRHELVHAFFFECGLVDYCSDEKLVDFIAQQFPKLQQIFQASGCLM